MRIHVTFIDRIGITQEVLALLVARNLNLDAVEMVPPNVYIDAPTLDADVLDELREALLAVRGVQAIRVVGMLPRPAAPPAARRPAAGHARPADGARQRRQDPARQPGAGRPRRARPGRRVRRRAVRRAGPAGRAAAARLPPADARGDLQWPVAAAGRDADRRDARGRRQRAGRWRAAHALCPQPPGRAPGGAAPQPCRKLRRPARRLAGHPHPQARAQRSPHWTRRC